KWNSTSPPGAAGSGFYPERNGDKLDPVVAHGFARGACKAERHSSGICLRPIGRRHWGAGEDVSFAAARDERCADASAQRQTSGGLRHAVTNAPSLFRHLARISATAARHGWARGSKHAGRVVAPERPETVTSLR